MKKLNLLLTALIFTASLFAQTKLPDKGLTSETHKKNVGKTLFSKTEVLFKKEMMNTWTTSFKWGDPIYARMYWAEGINNIYVKNGWAKPADTYRYVLRFYANGKYIAEKIMRSDGERTSLPLCLYPAKSDSYNWSEMHILADNLSKLKAGNNKIKVEVCAYTREGNKRSEAISSGSFMLNISQNAINSSQQVNFTGVKTAWSSSSDAWKEWNVSTNKGSGNLKSKYGQKDEWSYTVGNISGTIKTKWNNDYTEWELKSNNNTILMKRRWNNDWKEWTISDGSSSVILKTTWSNSDDAWKEWGFSGNKGKMQIKTAWSSSDDAWKEWNITDNMKGEKTEMKMAALFIVLYHAFPK